MNNLQKLESVQRQSLMHAMGAVKGTPVSALEVLSGIPPLHLRLKETLMHEFIHIMMKPPGNPLWLLISNFVNDPIHLDTKVVTPIHLIKTNLKQLEKHEKVILPLQSNVMPTVKDSFLPSLTRLTIMEQQLGSSKTRTYEQSWQARQISIDFITAQPRTSLLAFTDSSALTNPRPCGASTIIYA